MDREAGPEVEFVTLMFFNSPADVEAFAGEDFAVAHVPPPAREVLAHFDERLAHYEMLASHEY